MIKRRWGFKSKTQMDWFMVWDEDWFDGEVIFARVVFSLRYPFGVGGVVARLVSGEATLRIELTLPKGGES